MKSKGLSKIRLNEYGKNKIYLNDFEIGQIISIIYNKTDNNYLGIAIMKLVNLYDFEENTSLECSFDNSKINIKFPQYMLPLPRKS